jgi:hypothetical protein
LYGLEEIRIESSGNDQRFPFVWRNSRGLQEEFNKIFKEDFAGCRFPGWEDDGVPTTFRAILGLFNQDFFDERVQIYSQMDLIPKSDPLLETEEIRASGVTDTTLDVEAEDALLSMLDPASDDTCDDIFEDDEIDALLADIQTPIMPDAKLELNSAPTPIRKHPTESYSMEEGSLAAYYSRATSSDDFSIQEDGSIGKIPQLDGTFDDADIDIFAVPPPDYLDGSKNSYHENQSYIVRNDISSHNEPSHSQHKVTYTEPFFSKPADLPRNRNSTKKDNISSKSTKWEFHKAAPTSESVKKWKEINSRTNLLNRTTSFLEGPTQNSDKCIKRSQPASEKAQHKKNYLTLLSLEVHGKTLII